jgi:hypothetical protein
MISDRKLFQMYEELRASGKYNMVTDANKCMRILKWTPSDYYYVMFNYKMLQRKYGDSIAKAKNDKR